MEPHIRQNNFYGKYLFGIPAPQFWLSELLNETFYQTAMDHYRARHARPQFLVVSDDMVWCRAKLTGPDIHHVGSTVLEHEMVGPSPPRDLAVMALSNATIVSISICSLNHQDFPIYISSSLLTRMITGRTGCGAPSCQVGRWSPANSPSETIAGLQSSSGGPWSDTAVSQQER